MTTPPMPPASSLQPGGTRELAQRIRQLLHARPFFPFSIAQGQRAHAITDPTLVALSPTSTALYLAGESGLLTIPCHEITGVTLSSINTDPASTDLARIQLLVFDFDGVWSNNQVLVMQDGTEGVLCNRSDGLGLEMLRKNGMAMMVLSKEANPVVAARCRKVKIECLQGIDDKLTELRRISAERAVPLSSMAYVGNDLNDVACMQHVGLPIAVADAFEPALKVAQYVTRANGGFGAVREVIDLLLAATPDSAGYR